MKKVAIFFIVIAILFIVIRVLGYIYAREKEIDEKCNVHNVNMKSGMVPIAYGDHGITLLAAEKEKYFPNANSYVLGSCWVTPFSKSKTRAKFCDKCREIKQVVDEDMDVLRDAVFKLERAITIEDLNNILAISKNKLTSEISRLVIDDFTNGEINKVKNFTSKDSSASSSVPSSVTVSNLLSMPDVSITGRNFQGFYAHSTIKHDYEMKIIKDDEIVIDHATGLIWHQTGSDRYFNLDEARQWLKDLNQQNYAGFNNWRLPTLKESISLLESSRTKEKSKIINPVFCNCLNVIWTGDQYGKRYGAHFFWIVSLDYGYVFYRSSGKNGRRQLRPVLSRDIMSESDSSDSSKSYLAQIDKIDRMHIDTSRSKYRVLSRKDIISILKKYHFFDSSCNRSGCFQNDYVLKSINGNSVVIDNATGLMWHQNGADKHMRWKAAQKWIKELNKKGYAGYHDWRFPTVEEAASLLESSKKNGDLYIDPIFSNEQSGIWTGDKKSDSHDVWYVCFGIGRVYERNLCINDCVRPVRFGK